MPGHIGISNGNAHLALVGTAIGKSLLLLQLLWWQAFAGAAEPAQVPPGDPLVRALPPVAEAVVELDEVNVTGPRERARTRGLRALVATANNAMVRMETQVGVQLNLVKKRGEVVFRRAAAARKLPEAENELFTVNRSLNLQLRPDRLITPWPSSIGDAGYLLADNVDEADGLPAHIRFGADVALVNLDYVSLRDNEYKTRILLTNAMHPQSRRCESELTVFDFWPEGANQYILLGNSLRSCTRAARRRDGELLFAESVPGELRQALQQLHDPIASRLASRLGSEPGNMFVAWWPDSPHDGYRLQLSWNRNSLLLLYGSEWQQGIDDAQREALRTSFMREQIQRRIRESDWPGPFTQSAVGYLLLLTRSGEDQTTRQRLTEELPKWLARCAGGVQGRGYGADPGQELSSVECGLVLQFVYDAVARSGSEGKQNIFSTWRKLLDASFRRGESGVAPLEFLASSSEAWRIAQALVGGESDWPKFAAALEGVGVKLSVNSGGTFPEFEVQSMEHFAD
jgi:hypothetical protein